MPKKRCDACGKKCRRRVTDGYLVICKNCLPAGSVSGECNFCGEDSLIIKPIPVLLKETPEMLASFFVQMGCLECKQKEIEKYGEEYSKEIMEIVRSMAN